MREVLVLDHAGGLRDAVGGLLGEYQDLGDVALESMRVGLEGNALVPALRSTDQLDGRRSSRREVFMACLDNRFVETPVAQFEEVLPLFQLQRDWPAGEAGWLRPVPLLEFAVDHVGVEFGVGRLDV